jgi:hypothetical protein
MLHTRPGSIGSSFSITTAIKDNGTDAIYTNGVLALAESGKLPAIAGAQSTATVGRGYNNDTYFAGDIAEILVYRRALSAGERQAVETYLQSKYFSVTQPRAMLAGLGVKRLKPVELRAEYREGELWITWPLTSVPAVLQETVLLDEPRAWSEVVAPIIVRGDRNCAILPATGPTRFFRLPDP